MDKEDLSEVTGQLLKNRYFIALVAIIFVGSYLRFREAFFTGMWVDEGRHARIGYELADHLLQYSTSWLGEVTKFPPVYTYLLGISSAVMGKTEFAVRVVSPLIGSIGIAVSYFLGRELWDRDTGILVAALVAVNPLFWFLSTRILVGATLTVIYTATLVALYIGMSDREDYWIGLYLLGPLTAISVMTKQPAYTLGLLIPGYFLWRKRSEIYDFLNNIDEYRETVFYKETLTDLNYYIGAGLGVLTMLPWFLRNIGVCGNLLCGASRAVSFAQVAQKPAWESTGGPFYYFLNLPAIITLPATALLIGTVIYYIYSRAETDADQLVKILAAALLLNGAAYLVLPSIVPGTLLLSITFFAIDEAEKMLWGAIALGIGIMSIPQVKVNRYVVFLIPAIMSIIALNIVRLSRKLRSTFLEERDEKTWRIIAGFIAVPVIVFSTLSGLSMVSGHGYQQLDPAGEWISSNTPEDTVIAGSSPTQMRYYSYPRDSLRLPDNRSRFQTFLLNNSIDYLVMDVYERAQPHWAQTGVPPYRLPVATVQDIRSRRTSAQQVVNSYGSIPDYLDQVATFGSTRIPLTRNNTQPQLIIYQVNQTSLTSQ